MRRYLLRWESALVLLLTGELVLFGMINPRFLSLANLLSSSSDFVQIGIVALPLTLVIIAGGIDISFASLIGLCAIVFAIANFFGLPLSLSIAASLVIGVIAGAFNATIIQLAQMQPFVVTLGSLYLFRGAATVLSGVVGAGGYEGIGDFPDAFTSFAYLECAGVPAPFLVLLIEAALLFVILNFSRFGRLVFMCGLSEQAARYSGLPSKTIATITYVTNGFFAAVAGLVLSSYLGSARVDLGSATLLPAITAAVLGGASIYGGQGSIIATLLATLIIGYLQQGLTMSGVPSQISSTLSGLLLVVAVALRHKGTMLIACVTASITGTNRKRSAL